MSLITEVSLRVHATLTKASDLGADTEDDLDFVHRVRLLSGTTAGKADKLWYDERTLGASATEDLDLVGALSDAFGATVSQARIKGLYVLAEPKDPDATRNTNNVVIGGASATQWAALLGTTGTVTVRPGCLLAVQCGELDATGYVCAAGATDLLKVANSAGSTGVTYQIIVIGASA
jgi:hypothetical protein